MNEEALARSTILCGFDGDVPPEGLSQFAGCILFARNGTSVQAVRALTDVVRQRFAGGDPPLIAMDQEGGRVARLQSGVETVPPAMAFGAARSADLARRAGEQVAFDLRRAGVTLDFAPVLDLALDGANTVIGTRAFAADPQAVAELGAAFAAGLRDGGVIPTFKHFPGHGATSVDSHVDLPVIDASVDVLRARDLVPFAAVAREAEAIMGAHAIVRALDAREPATRSRAAIELLRNELGFNGAYVTDCLHMAAASGDGGIPAAALASLEAGADLLLVSHSIETAHEAATLIAHAVREGRVPAERLQRAAERVRVLRAAGRNPLPIGEFPPHPGIGREAARRGLTLVRGVAHADPLAAIVVSFESATAEGAQGSHDAHPSLRREAPVLAEVRLPLDPADADVGAALAAVERSRRRPLVLCRRAHLYPAQARAVERFLQHDRDAVVVSMREPFDVALFPQARHVLAAYGDDLACVGALADVLFGGSAPEGRLPVDVAVG